MSKYFGIWGDRESMISSFEYSYWGGQSVPDYSSYPSEEEILFATYDTGDYDGSCTVLFEKNGQLFRVDGGHCSCGGLEDQWSPEETTWEAEAMRPRDSYSYMGSDAHKAFWFLVDSRVGRR